MSDSKSKYKNNWGGARIGAHNNTRVFPPAVQCKSIRKVINGSLVVIYKPIVSKVTFCKNELMRFVIFLN